MFKDVRGGRAAASLILSWPSWEGKRLSRKSILRVISHRDGGKNKGKERGIDRKDSMKQGG